MAAEVADEPPKKITTDKWRAYIKPIKDILPEAEHVQSQGIRAEVNNNLSATAYNLVRMASLLSCQ